MNVQTTSLTESNETNLYQALIQGNVQIHSRYIFVNLNRILFQNTQIKKIISTVKRT